MGNGKNCALNAAEKFQKKFMNFHEVVSKKDCLDVKKLTNRQKNLLF